MTQLEISAIAFDVSDNGELASASASVSQNVSYKKFIKVIKKALRLKRQRVVAVKYMDDENDEVTLANDADLRIAFCLAERSGNLPVHLYITSSSKTDNVEDNTESEPQIESDTDMPVNDGNISSTNAGDRTRLCRKAEKKVRRLQKLVRREDSLKGEIRSILDELDTSSKSLGEMRMRLESVKVENEKHQSSASSVSTNEGACSSLATCVPKEAVGTTTEDLSTTCSEAELVKMISERLTARLSVDENSTPKQKVDVKSKFQFGTSCNVCGLLIDDVLYRCTSCKFYNLCGRCESNENWRLHADGSHLFVKVRKPLSVRQTAMLTSKLPLLDSQFFTENTSDSENSTTLRSSFVRFCSDEIINTKLNERELVTFLWIERKRAKRIAKIERCHQICDRALEAFQRTISDRMKIASNQQDGVQTFFDKHADSSVSLDEKLLSLARKIAKCFQQEEKQRRKLIELFEHVSSKLEFFGSTQRSYDLRAAIASLREHYANKLARRLAKQTRHETPKRSAYNSKQIEVLRELVRRCDAQLQIVERQDNQFVLPSIACSAVNQQNYLIGLSSELQREDGKLDDLWRLGLKSSSVKHLCSQLNKYASKLKNRIRKSDALKERTDRQSKKLCALVERAVECRERIAKLENSDSENGYLKETERGRRLAQLELITTKHAAVQQALGTASAKLSKTSRKISRLRSKMMAIAVELNGRGEEHGGLANDAELDARILEWRLTKQDAKLKAILRKIDQVTANAMTDAANRDHFEQLRFAVKLRKLEAKAERKRCRLNSMRKCGTPVVAPTRLYDSRFVKDVTIPDGSRVMPGASFAKSWRVVNCGLALWHSESVQLDCVDYADSTCTFAASLTELHRGAITATPSGNEVVISVILSAPMRPGVVRSTWQLRSKDGRFGDRLWCLVEVSDENIGSQLTHSIEYISLQCSTVIGSDQATTSDNEPPVSVPISEPSRDNQCDEQQLEVDSLQLAPVDVEHSGSSSSTISRRSSVVSLASSVSSDDFVKLPVPIPACFDTSEEEMRIQQLASRTKVRSVGSLTQSFSSQAMQASINAGPLDASFSSCVDSSQFSLEASRTNRVDSVTSSINAQPEVALEAAMECRSTSEKRSHSQAFDNELNQPNVSANTSEGSVQDADAMSDYQIITPRSHSISYCESIEGPALDDEESDTDTEVDEDVMDSERHELELELELQPESDRVACASPLSAASEPTADSIPQAAAEPQAEDTSAAPVAPEQTDAVARNENGEVQNAVPLVKLAQNALTFANRAVSIAYDVYTSMQARDRMARTSESQLPTSATTSSSNDASSASPSTVAQSEDVPASVASTSIAVVAAPRPVPPTSTWMPTRQPLPQSIANSNSTWNPPTSQWTPPPVVPVPSRQTQVMQASDPNDPAQRLFEMGFCNRERNAALLKRHRNEIDAVVNELLRESDNDWFAHRH